MTNNTIVIIGFIWIYPKKVFWQI